MNYYRRYVGDYLRDTARLSLLEHGAYTLLLDNYYAEKMPIPLDLNEVYTMVRAMTPGDRQAVKKVLTRYFTKKADGYHNARADREIAKARSAIDQMAEAGRRGAVKRWGTDEGGDVVPHRKADEGDDGVPHRETDGVKDGVTDAGGDATTSHQPPTTKPPSTEPPSTGGNQPLRGLSGAKPDAPVSGRKNGHNGEHARRLRASAIEVLEFLNEKTQRNYQPVAANVDLIVARMKQGATLDDCRAVVAKKCREWAADEKMAPYLRPKTLFNATNFAQYQGEIAPAGGPQ